MDNPPAVSCLGISFYLSGSHLLSHIVSNIVPSAVQVLTIVFGMRTGVSPGRIATGNIFQVNSLANLLKLIRLRIYL